MQERQVRASLCRLEQGVGGKNCGSGKQVIGDLPKARAKAQTEVP